MAYAVPPGLLPAMPKLRWAQAMTAGVEGWIALPDLPASLTLTCARGTHRESMPENIIGALLYVAKPYAAAVENQEKKQLASGMITQYQDQFAWFAWPALLLLAAEWWIGERRRGALW